MSFCFEFGYLDIFGQLGRTQALLKSRIQERRFEYILAFADHAEPIRGHPPVNFGQPNYKFLEIDPALEKMRNWTQQIFISCY